MNRKGKILNDPKAISELNRLKSRSGLIQPEDVVRAARKPSSAMHKYFTWDNTEAAEKWRIHQARNFLRVVVTYKNSGDGNTPLAVNAFVSLSPDRYPGGGYRAIADVMSNNEHYAVMLQDALDELDVFRKKYQRIQELSSVFAAIEETKSSVKYRTKRRKKAA